MCNQYGYCVHVHERPEHWPVELGTCNSSCSEAADSEELLTHGCCCSKTKAHLCKSRPHWRVEICTSAYQCITVLKLTRTRPSSAQVFLFFCCARSFQPRSVEGLDGGLNPRYSQGRRSLTLRRALLCCGHNHVDKTRRSVNVPRHVTVILRMVCRAGRPTLGQMIVLCTHKHHWRDARRCSSICLQPDSHPA